MSINQKFKVNKSHGVLFWIEGFSGSGKTSISKNIQKDLSKTFGKTIILSGDILRKFFDRSGYSKKERIKDYLTLSFIN